MKWLACLMLILLIASPIPAQSGGRPLLEPPPHLQNMTVLNGETVLFFTRAGWEEMSGLILDMMMRVAEAASAETARQLEPLRAQAEAERTAALAREKREKRRNLPWKIAAGVATAFAVWGWAR